MSNTAKPLDRSGFPGFFRTPAEWQSVPETRAYRHHLQRAWDRFKLTAVFCIEGKPTVFFTKVKKADPNQEADWQKLLWNQGMAALLVVEDPVNTRMYSALSKPNSTPPAEDDDRLAAVFETAALASDFTQFLFSIQTGQFYRDRPSKFRQELAVDQYLLNNLSATRDELVAETDGSRLSPDIAHAFLGRCLFTCYLIEREVIGRPQLKNIGAPIASNLRRILEDVNDSEAVKLLFRLFRLLDEDFNGTMFGSEFSAEQPNLRARHVSTLRRFLSGEDLETGQRLLPGFDLYDFHFIPIELISAIYEDFIVGREKSEKRSGKTEQRKVGAFYTPPRLAELVVDIATEGWETLLGKRYLDPACGSGVFLVILFQRMAAEWLSRHPRAGNMERAREIRGFLTHNLCGIDLDPTACKVACFSLYLAFLDQLEPRDIWALKETLETTGEGKVLPPLHSQPGNPLPDSPVILEANFFNQVTDRLGQFDLVIGNPPWVGRNHPAESEMKAWLMDQKRNPFLKDAPKSETKRSAQFLPQKQSAVGFMWRVPLYVKNDGIACLVLPSRVILSNQTDAFQAAWFRRFTVEAVWQLADYSFVLFKGADCPAIIAKFRPGKPNPATAKIAYFTPKVERFDPRRASILVSPEDQKLLPLADLQAAAAEDRAYMFWKMPFWGTDRDRRLLDRLRTLPTTLGDLAGEPNDNKRWIKGQGFKPWHQKSYEANPEKYGEPKHRWWEDAALYLDARSKAWGLHLLPDNCDSIGPSPSQLHRLPSKRVFSAPLVLINQGCSRFAFSDFDILFQHSLQSIAGPRKDEDLLLFLTAVLNSPLATYFLFHTSANWGVERDKVHFEELLRLPFPLPEQTKNPAASCDIIRKAADQLRRALEEMAAYKRLDKTRREAVRHTTIRDLSELVFEYFDFSKWERALVEDTCTIFEPSSTPGSVDSDIPTLQDSQTYHRKEYAELLIQTINRWARRSNYSLVPSAVVAKMEGLALLTLVKTGKGEKLAAYQEKPTTMELRSRMLRIAKASVRGGLGGLSYLRGFAFFENQQVHILKPLSRRQWTRTAAFNDADELADFIASMGQND